VGDSIPERRDSVAIPRPAFSFAAALAILVLGGVGGVLWSVTTASISLEQRVAQLENFSSVGARFTKQDGDRLREELAALRAWRQAHTEFGYEVVGRWNQLHTDHKRRLELLEREIHGEDH